MFPLLLSAALVLAAPPPGATPKASKASKVSTNKTQKQAQAKVQHQAEAQLETARHLMLEPALAQLNALVDRHGKARSPGLRAVVNETPALKVRLLFDASRFPEGAIAYQSLAKRRPDFANKGKGSAEARPPQQPDSFLGWDLAFAEQLFKASEALYAQQLNAETDPSHPSRPTTPCCVSSARPGNLAWPTWWPRP